MHPVLRFTPPPRRVPLSLKIVNFNNLFAQIGWFVFGFGMIFFWAFAGNADFSFVTFRGDIEQTTGKVLRVEQTGASENERPVMKHVYEFSLAGQRHTGIAYTTGDAASQGAEVLVEYSAGNPERSRIAGMRRAPFGPWAAIVAIFPLIGFVVLYFGAKSGSRRNLLLERGILTTGTLIGKRETNVTVNKRRVWALTFEFIARDGRRCEAEGRSTDPERMEDEAQEPLLYDPDDPSRAYMLDEAPARPEFDQTGELRGRPFAALFAIIVPAVVILGHAAFFYFRFRE
jgi:Protein of unknown function (DUF3592)